MFSFVIYPALRHILLKMLMEISNPKSNLLDCDIQYEQERARWAVYVLHLQQSAQRAEVDVSKSNTSRLCNWTACTYQSGPLWQPTCAACNFSTPFWPVCYWVVWGESPRHTAQSSAHSLKYFKKCFAGIRTGIDNMQESTANISATHLCLVYWSRTGYS